MAEVMVGGRPVRGSLPRIESGKLDRRRTTLVRSSATTVITLTTIPDSRLILKLTISGHGDRLEIQEGFIHLASISLRNSQDTIAQRHPPKRDIRDPATFQDPTGTIQYAGSESHQ